MSMDKLSAETRTALTTASRVAASLKHLQVRPEHLLIGLFAVSGCSAAQILLGYGLHVAAAESQLAAIAPPGSVPAGSTMFSTASGAVLSDGQRRALSQGMPSLDVDNLAYAIFAGRDPLVVRILASVNLTCDTVLAALEASVTPEAGGRSTDPGGDDETNQSEEAASGNLLEPAAGVPAPAAALGQALTEFGEDLVDKARSAGFDRVTGRDKELERVITILARRTKNNPILIGEPGVGKTAVVEALAQKIADGDVPDFLTDRPVVSLDLAGMVAGSRYRGDFEERLRHTLAQAREANAVVFIDEIHQIVGAGNATGGMDVANTLKPLLARGELSLIGATTLEEFRKHIEPDAALERRLQPVLVAEPSVAVTVDILTTLRPAYSAHHRATFTDAALSAAAKLAHRYINDRFLPDKAIDVLDEAGAACAMRIMNQPAEVRSCYAQKAELDAQLRSASTAGDLDRLDQLHRRLAGLATQLPAGSAGLDVIDAAHIADVVSAITGVPVSAIGEVEAERLRGQGTRLAARVVGQDAAVDAVSRTVRRARQGLAAARTASFIFAGPTGVGKTELAKALAEDLFGDGAEGRGAFITLDMSEYSEKQSVSRLFGAPPGYVGYEDGGQLTEKVRRNPYAVVLLDEVEKAHTDVFDALLQVLDEGRLTDAAGRSVDFRNVIVIMTTNLGAARAVKGSVGFGGRDAASLSAAAELETRAALKEHFRPEFLNRVDEIVVFSQLGRAELAAIVDKLLSSTRTQLADRGITLELTPAGVDAVLAAGYDPTMGARPLKRAIVSMLIDPLSEMLLAGRIVAGQHALADAGPDSSLLQVSATEPGAETGVGVDLAAELGEVGLLHTV